MLKHFGILITLSVRNVVTVRHGLSLWSSYQTEMIVKQKVTFQSQELGQHCSLTVTHQPGRRDFRLYSVQRDIGSLGFSRGDDEAAGKPQGDWAFQSRIATRAIVIPREDPCSSRRQISAHNSLSVQTLAPAVSGSELTLILVT